MTEEEKRKQQNMKRMYDFAGVSPVDMVASLAAVDPANAKMRNNVVNYTRKQQYVISAV